MASFSAAASRLTSVKSQPSTKQLLFLATVTWCRRA